MTAKKYRISHKALLAMQISDEARGELIKAGVAEPDAHTQRLAELPADLPNDCRSIIGHMLAAVDTANATLDDGDSGVRLVLQVRAQKTVVVLYCGEWKLADNGRIRRSPPRARYGIGHAWNWFCANHHVSETPDEAWDIYHQRKAGQQRRACAVGGAR